MYTEDDDFSEKDEDSKPYEEEKHSNKYDNYYTSFNDLEAIEPGNRKKKTKDDYILETEESEEPEEDYSTFYNSPEDETKDEDKKDNHKKMLIIKIVALVILIIAVIVLLILLLTGISSVKGDIELINEEITLNVGEKSVVSYKIVDTESNVTSKFTSSDNSIVVVNDNGEVFAIKNGEALITISYTIDGFTREKECKVVVTGEGSVDNKVTLELTNVKDDTWTNKDVEIGVSANSVYGIDSIKYAINCDSNCTYQNVVDNKIVISDAGTTKVTVEVEDKGHQKTSKTVTVKIDKEAPSATLIGDTNITGETIVTVCASCTDTLSGCKKEKFCQNYNSSKSSQTIVVEDNAGNTKQSQPFNVTVKSTKTPTPTPKPTAALKTSTPIPRTNQACSLTVSSTGLVTATLRGDASYYGFNSSYKGNNQKSRQINIPGNSGAQIVRYYVKYKDGTGGMCFIVVEKKCTDQCVYSGH